MNLQLLYMVRRIFFLFLILTVFFACNENDKLIEEVEKIPMELQVMRFDRELAQTSAESFPALKNKYPYLFPAQYPDSIWIQKLDDTIQVELLDEVGKAFPDFKDEKKNLEQLYKHIKYYFPKINGPRVLTVTSNVDYQNRIISHYLKHFQLVVY